MPYPLYQKKMKAQKKRERRARREVRSNGILTFDLAVHVYSISLSQLVLSGMPVPKKKQRVQKRSVCKRRVCSDSACNGSVRDGCVLMLTVGNLD